LISPLMCLIMHIRISVSRGVKPPVLLGESDMVVSMTRVAVCEVRGCLFDDVVLGGVGGNVDVERRKDPKVLLWRGGHVHSLNLILKRKERNLLKTELLHMASFTESIEKLGPSC
jgi:hypothetical protein